MFCKRNGVLAIAVYANGFCQDGNGFAVHAANGLLPHHLQHLCCRLLF